MARRLCGAPTSSKHGARAAFFALLAASLVGCGKGAVALHSVVGSVTFDTGEAVPFGIVEFRPVEGGPIARGKLDQQGRFSLQTFVAGDGAVAGQHRIVVVQHLAPQAAAAAEHDDHLSRMVAPEFASYDSSGLVADVKPDVRNAVTLVVRRPAPRH